jgi:hypothetical protein
MHSASSVMRPNSTPHTDARVGSALQQPPSARAGGRERYPAYAKHSEAAPEWYGFCRRIDAEMSVEPMPFDCQRIVYSGSAWLITMEK